MKINQRQIMTLGAGALGLLGVFAAFHMYTLHKNLTATARITQTLKTDLEKLETENNVMKDESQARQTELSKLNQQLESLRVRDTASGKRNTELEKLVADAEASLNTQTAKISEMETKLKETEERLKRQREKSENAARDAKNGGTADYAKLMEVQWLSALAQTETLQKELEETTLALADGNSSKARLQRETATMHYNLAVILTGQGKFDAAVREYDRVIQIRPEDSDAHYNLAVLYDTELKDRAKALEHYRRYVELMPNGPDTPKVKLWIKDKEFEGRLDHPTFLPKEEKRF